MSSKHVIDYREDYSYFRPLTPDEKTALRAEISESVIQLKRIAAEKKAMIADFKDQAKPYETQKNESADILKQGLLEVNENCIKSVNAETRMVEYINDAGVVVGTRMARPEEFQVPMFKTGTDNQ